MVVLVGKPGVGKTSRIIAEIERDYGSLEKAHYQSESQWWDGYQQQPVVVLDDFAGWIPLHTFLKLIDVVPIKLQVKGGFTTWFTSKTMYISSNFMPLQWWKNCSPNQYDAITRRISKLVLWDRDGEVQIWSTNADENAWDAYMRENRYNDDKAFLGDEEPQMEPVL